MTSGSGLLHVASHFPSPQKRKVAQTNCGKNSNKKLNISPVEDFFQAICLVHLHRDGRPLPAHLCGNIKLPVLRPTGVWPQLPPSPYFSLDAGAGDAVTGLG